MTRSTYNSALHRTAWLTAAATFPLIFMGGLVTSHQAGMSVPDWPNSYGYNMFLFPPRLWVGGVLYEHTHRLMGSVVGMLSIALMVVAWKTERRRWVRWLATGVLAAVIAQGVLGGLRVVLLELDLAVVHACFAQAFFCLAALTVVVTSRWWVEAKDRQTGTPAGRGLVPFAAVAVVAIYLQLVAGALMRHHGAGLAIPDLPLAYGKVLPPVSEARLRVANESRVWEGGLARVTLGQVWLHFTHRAGAIVVSAAVVIAAVRVLRRHRREGLTGPAVAMLVLLAAQVALGVFTVLKRKPADVASAHVAVGALLLAATFVLTVRAARLYWRLAPRAAARPAEAAESFEPDLVAA